MLWLEVGVRVMLGLGVRIGVRRSIPTCLPVVSQNCILAYSLPVYQILQNIYNLFQCVDLTMCPLIDLSLYLSVNVSICQCVYLSVCRSFNVSIGQCVYLSICQFVNLSMCLSVSVSICQCVNLSVCRFVNVPIGQCVDLSNPFEIY